MRHSFRAGCVFFGVALSTVSLGGCSLASNQMTFDRSGNKDIQDYRDGLSPQRQPADAKTAPLPPFQSFVATPADLKLPSPLVTVSVDQTVSLRDLMFELAQQAGVDIEMDPDIHGTIIFTAKDRPFNEVVDRICNMAGLRYTFKDNVLRIQLDRPYVQDYKVDYMSLARKSASDIETGISSGTGGAGSSGNPTASTGSDSKINSTNDANFWEDLGSGLKQVLAASDNYVSLATQQDPVAVTVPPPAPPPLPGGNGANPPPPPSNVPPSLNVSVSSSSATPKNPPATFSISKETGIVSVYGTERQQKMVQKYLNRYARQALAQVLIEAKVLEVSLNDQYATGIDWGQLGANLTHLVSSAQINMPAPAFTPADPTNSAFTANLDLGHGFKPVIQALSEFGTVRSLSSPRVTVMNNQTAIVNVAKNLIYFQIKVTTTPASAAGVSPTITYNSTQESVPDGILMSVTPTVDVNSGEVMMAVRPTVTKEVDTVNDPSIALSILSSGGSLANVPNNPIPEMDVQELDSVIKMQSGQTMVMGGLMQDSNQVNQVGVPVVGDVPILGSLFHNHGDNINKSELIIFLQATIVPGANVQPMDRRVYKEFGDDTRPFQM
ncbi:MAG: secretin N-terminal domain-containing protein [Alphaproteobacteria bacterium]|nr:secretin N-terminal domain-containing protein [Alphaproteobacteria bacterium]MDE2336116.1 secretin N-terminal domain-containing protein [Alphaproteobacteria bacterium]